jgi:hypothetical protein
MSNDSLMLCENSELINAVCLSKRGTKFRTKEPSSQERFEMEFEPRKGLVRQSVSAGALVKRC